MDKIDSHSIVQKTLDSGLALETQRLTKLLKSHKNYLACRFWLAKESVGWRELEAQQIDAVRKGIFSSDYSL